MDDYNMIKNDINHTRIVRFLESYYEELDF